MTLPGAEQMARRSDSPCNATTRGPTPEKSHPWPSGRPGSLYHASPGRTAVAAPWLLRAGTLAVLALLVLALALALLRRRPALERGRLLEHVEELRRRLLVVAGVLVAGTFAALTVRIEERGGWPVPTLGLYDTLASQLFRAAADALLPAGVQLIVTGPADGFVAQFSIAL